MGEGGRQGGRGAGRRGRRWVGLALLIPLVLGLAGGWPPAAGQAAQEAPITAGNAAVLAEPGGVVLYNRAMHERVAPASLTKIMTARVALLRADPGLRLTVAPGDLVGQASMGLRAGQTLSLETLLHGLLLPSGNDAAMTIARGLGARDGAATDAEAVARFVGWMNEEAARLELRDTHFVNPHGLDRPGHYSSAYDLARLALVAWHDPRLARVAGRLVYTGDGYVLRHGHALVGHYPGVLGGKTGRTRGCQSCLLTLAERAGRRLAVVVLRDTRQQVVADSMTLLEWGFHQPPTTPTPTIPAPTATPPPPPTPTPPPATPAPLPPTPTPRPPTATRTPPDAPVAGALTPAAAPSPAPPAPTSIGRATPVPLEALATPARAAPPAGTEASPAGPPVTWAWLGGAGLATLAALTTVGALWRRRTLSAGDD